MIEQYITVWIDQTILNHPVGSLLISSYEYLHMNVCVYSESTAYIFLLTYIHIYIDKIPKSGTAPIPISFIAFTFF